MPARPLREQEDLLAPGLAGRGVDSEKPSSAGIEGREGQIDALLLEHRVEIGSDFEVNSVAVDRAGGDCAIDARPRVEDLRALLAL